MLFRSGGSGIVILISGFVSLHELLSFNLKAIGIDRFIKQWAVGYYYVKSMGHFFGK